ncbi:hypothetical protein FA15DRAFT_561661, partial [Coprinopsis marcescibilis]
STEDSSNSTLHDHIDTFNFNPQQQIAYDIIVNHFTRRHLNADPDEPPLRMLMTGPGGTGKTYVVRAVKQMMMSHNAAHRIRFLAPTGSAAALIDGMTIHKGLGIKIERARKSNKENHTTKLREEWKNVDILFLDEASLLSAQLLCKI